MPETQVYIGKLTIESIGVKEAIDGLTKLDAVAKKLNKSLSGIKVTPPKTDFSKATKSANEAGKKIETALNDAAKLVDLEEISDQFDRVRQSGETIATGSKRWFQSLNTAARKAFNIPTVDELNEQIIGIADSTDRSTRALRTQGNVLKQSITTEFGKGSGVVGEFNKQITRTNRAINQVAVTAKTSGDITRALARAQQEVRGLTTEYEILRARGVLKTGTASDEAFKKMIADAKKAAADVEKLALAHQKTKKRIDESRTAQAKSSQVGEKMTATFRGLASVLTKTFAAFRKGKSDVTEVNDAIKKTETQIEKVSQEAGLLKTAFTEAFAGAVFGVILSDLLGVDDILGEIKGTLLGIGGASRQITAALGLGADSAINFGNVVTEVYGNNFGESINDVGSVIETVTLRMQRFGELSEEELVRASENAIRLRDTYDTNYI
jgi:transcriptional regulator NrdR family protein